jgi:hypothetical protein
MKFNIFKREKLKNTMPEPNFENNWKTEQYEKNVKQGVNSLKFGTPVSIMDDGRGYELALDIKRQFILEYQKQLSEQIKIEGSNPIIIKRIIT